jgi:hypothetical protein
LFIIAPYALFALVTHTVVGWPCTFACVAPRALTRRAGDMGNTLYNNQGNMAEDCASGKIDAILHMGDRQL